MLRLRHRTLLVERVVGEVVVCESKQGKKALERLENIYAKNGYFSKVAWFSLFCMLGVLTLEKLHILP